MSNPSNNTLNTKIINTAPSDTQTKEQESNTLMLSPLSAPAPTVKRDPAVQKEGDIIRIDY